MAYFHQRRWIRTRLPAWRVSLIATLYYAEIFPPVRIQIPVQRFSLMATVPILWRISVPGIRIRIRLRWWKWAFTMDTKHCDRDGHFNVTCALFSPGSCVSYLRAGWTGRSAPRWTWRRCGWVSPRGRRSSPWPWRPSAGRTRATVSRASRCSGSPSPSWPWGTRPPRSCHTCRPQPETMRYTNEVQRYTSSRILSYILTSAWNNEVHQWGTEVHIL